MASIMGVHYLTVKNFIRRRRKEFLGIGKDKKEMKECQLIEIPLNETRPVIKIQTTVGGLKIKTYTRRMEQKQREGICGMRCTYAERESHGQEVKPWTICYSTISAKPTENKL